ncbi:MAG: hypothetical protein U0V74_16415 [Chitinophagales bacterium]
MQAPTHLLIGVIIQKLFDWRRYRAISFLLVAAVAFFCHGLLDEFSRFTYNPDISLPIDPFWVVFQIVVLLFTITLLYQWWGIAKWGIVFSLLPDIEWIFIDIQKLFNIEIAFYKTPYIHNFLHSVYGALPPFSYMDMLPDWSRNYWACAIEVAVIVLLLLTLRAIYNQRRNIHF